MNIHPKATATKIAACAMFDLDYWADHPLPGRVWAVDSHRQAHIVRIYASKGTAALQREGTRVGREAIWPYRRIVDEPTTYDVSEPIPFKITDDTQLRFVV